MTEDVARGECPSLGSGSADAGATHRKGKGRERRSKDRRGGDPTPFLRALRNLSHIITAGGEGDTLLRKICDSLVSDRGYCEVWIVEVDAYGKIVTAVRGGHIPPSEGFETARKKGKLPSFARKAATSKGVETTPCKAEVNGQSAAMRRMTVRLEYGFEACGVLSCLMPSSLSRKEEEGLFLEEVADRVALTLHNLDLEADREAAAKDLNENTRKLKYIYAISKLVGKQGLSADRILQAIADLIPLAWQHPETICARIHLEDAEFKTENFRTTSSPLVAPIMARGERLGAMEVGHFGEDPSAPPRSFTPDEQGLIQSIAGLLAGIVQRSRTEQQLTDVLQAHENILETVPSCLFLLDQSLTVVLANRRCAEYSDLAADEIVGKKLEEVLPPSLLESGSLVERVRAVARGDGGHDSLDATYALAGRPTQRLRFRLCGIPAEEGAHDGARMLLVIDDVTGQRTASDA